jgi:hypothetical protein
MRNCVIHRKNVVNQSKIEYHKREYRNKVLSALSVIEDIINDPDTMSLGISSVADFFEAGEEVTLYGAYLGGCLHAAYKDLEAKGVKPRYHPIGCIPFP